MSDSEQSVNFAEYSYEKAITNKDKVKRILYFALVVFIIILPVIIAVILHVYFIIFITPLFVFMGVPLAKFFFRYLQNEYRYTVDRSNFKMELIHGKAKPKLLYETDVKDMSFAVPATEENRQKYSDGIDKTVYCCISETSPDLYMTSFKTKSGKTVLMYFEGSKKALKIMNYYNKNIEVSNTLNH